MSDHNQEFVAKAKKIKTTVKDTLSSILKINSLLTFDVKNKSPKLTKNGHAKLANAGLLGNCRKCGAQLSLINYSKSGGLVWKCTK